MTSPDFVECQLCGEPKPFPQGFRGRVQKWCQPCYVLVVRKRWVRGGSVLIWVGAALLPTYAYAPNPYRLIAGWTLGISVFLGGLFFLSGYILAFGFDGVPEWFGKRFGRGNREAARAVENAVSVILFVLVFAFLLGWCTGVIG